jgi:hypothetical protein
VNLGAVPTTNEGVQKACGEFILILDHDDELVPEALHLLVQRWESYPGTDRGQLSGVGARCVDENGSFMGTPFPRSPLVTNELELRHVLKTRGELTGMGRSSLLKPFYAQMEPGMTNGFVWRQMARQFQAIYTNDVIRVYHTEVADSISKARHIRHSAGAARQFLADLNQNLDYFQADPVYFARTAVFYARYSLYAKRSLTRAFADLTTALGRLLFLVSLPVALAFFARDRMQGRI